MSASDDLEGAFASAAGHLIDRPAMLTAWVAVLEWTDDEGARWLSKLQSGNLPPWIADGMHHEAIYGDWPDDEGDD